MPPNLVRQRRQAEQIDRSEPNLTGVFARADDLADRLDWGFVDCSLGAEDGAALSPSSPPVSPLSIPPEFPAVEGESGSCVHADTSTHDNPRNIHGLQFIAGWTPVHAVPPDEGLTSMTLKGPREAQ